MNNWRVIEDRDTRSEFKELKEEIMMFPTKEEARQLYGLPKDEDLIFEINIGGPPEKAYGLAELLARRLQEVVNTHDRVRVFWARDPETRSVVPDRLAITAGPKRSEVTLQ